jgi:hypothetical protein
MKAQYFLLLPCLVSLAACSQKKEESCNTGTAPTPVCAPLDYASLDSAPVSFATDVYPRLRAGCSAPFCHGVKPTDPPQSQPSAQLYLGFIPDDDPTMQPTADQLTADRSLVISLLVDAKSTTAAAMKRVVAGDPANSFAMLKLTGCQGNATGFCAVQPAQGIVTYINGCGDVMPPACDHADWTGADTVLFARWIKQGAADN